MNTPAPTKSCRQCGGPMASNAPEGLCARCLLSVAMKDSEPADTEGLTQRHEGTKRIEGVGAGSGSAAAPGPVDFPDIGDAADVARRLPQFEIMELLGRGGMGVVYKARQLNLDRVVALKILPPGDALTPDFVERFRREARSLAKLSHPNIVNVHDFGESGGLYYFVMEFVDGVNLREMIRAGKMKPEEALTVVPKICDALEFAHEEGVVHRDIKPENILIDKRGRVKIADFGLAKLLRREQTDHTLTMSGMTLGTPRYMAPEQIDKPETVDHRADIYSLGVVFYEMLTGEVPMGRFAPPSEKVRIDVRLDEIVLHALEHDVDRRYQHASQVRDDVERVTSKPVAAPLSSLTPPAAPVAGGVFRDAGDIKPAQLTPLPHFFWLRSFGALMLGWIAVGALWNHGLTGFVFGSVVMAAIVKEIGRSHANRNPLWVKKIRARSPWKRFTILFINLSILAVFLMAFIGGLFLLWDSSTMRKNILAPTAEEFEVKYKGKEYQLIRGFSAFKDQVPAVELTNDMGTYAEGGKTRAPFAWLFIIYGSLMLLFFFQQSAGEQANPVLGLRRGGWRAAFASVGAFLATLFFAYTAHSVFSMFHNVGRTFTDVTNAFEVHANVKQATTALHQWASENGYASASNGWNVQTVPKGEEVARVQVFDAWKDSPFERWRMAASGLERPFPHIAVQLIGTDKPKETRVMINCGYGMDSMPENGSEKLKRWQAIIKSLSDAVSKSSVFDPLNYAEKPAVKQTATGLPWPDLCGVLAAMLVWIFVIVRYLTPAPASATPAASAPAGESL